MGGGIATELVRNVFKNRSLIRANYSHGRGNMLEKRRWSAVRSYLCGDEWNSVAADKDSASVISSSEEGDLLIQQEFSSDVAVQDSGSIRSSKPPEIRTSSELNSDFAQEVDDSASIKSSEATVTQPILGETVEDYKDNAKNAKREEEVGIEKPNSTLKLFQQEDAAIVIQSAYRHYLARRERSELKLDDGLMQEVKFPIPSPESFDSSSLKVQIGDSTDASSFDVEREKMFCQPIQKRVRAQVLKLQEDWDDSTVSSSISRKRVQNRIEAATRRERALAYAFAQQLRVCAKKKRTKCNGLDSSNSSLRWLERWMATREAESENNILILNMADNQRRKQKQKLELRSCEQEKMGVMLDAVEEKESCGSNEVSLQVDGFSVKNDNFRAPYKSRGKAVTVRNNISRRKTVPTTHSAKATKKCHLEHEKGNKDSLKQPDSKKDVKQDSLSTIT